MFVRNLTYKFMFDDDRLHFKSECELSEMIKHSKMGDFRALRDLMLLLDENGLGRLKALSLTSMGMQSPLPL